MGGSRLSRASPRGDITWPLRTPVDSLTSSCHETEMTSSKKLAELHNVQCTSQMIGNGTSA